jgi:hypothetical protein
MPSATGPTARWFLARALDGVAPKLALFDAAVATAVAAVAAVVWRVGAGPRAGYEQIVPMLGTSLRWSAALPIAWAALGAIEADRAAGLLDLARRRGVPLRRWLLGRALGAGVLITLAVGLPMVLTSILLAGLGGGLEGALARLSLVVPSMIVGVATGLVFGLGGVIVGALSPSRLAALGALVVSASLGVLVDLAVPGVVGLAAHQLASPFLALEDLQAMLFAAPRSSVRGAAAAVAIAALPLLGMRAAEAAMVRARDGGRP